MAKEIERKFLLDRKAALEWIKGQKSYLKHTIKQGYISAKDGKVVRVRSLTSFVKNKLLGDYAFLTIKGPAKGISRDEFEYDIPPAEAKEMLRKLCSHIVEKDRYVVTGDDGSKWEIDIFRGKNQGLAIAEIELKRATQKFKKIPILLADVSADRKYSNTSLAENPYRTWSKRK
jgi:adenylate cyclase